MSAILYVVGTPIGNLEDISARALRILGSVELIAAEDTRQTSKLLRHYQIRTPMRSLHIHNEARSSEELVAWLAEGHSLALVSDAGMPLISDPGFPLVRAAREAGFAMQVVPGPTAVTAALAVCGLPVDRFVFEGFLASSSGARQRQLEALRHEPRTLVLYEAPHRLAACLGDIAAVLGGDRQMRLARELTKRFESVHEGSASELAQWASEPGPDRKGEFVVVIAGAEELATVDDLQVDRLLRELSAELPARKAARIVANFSGRRANELYRRLQQMD